LPTCGTLSDTKGSRAMTQQIFLNLPVSNLERSKTFYQALGFRLEPRFTNDRAACVVISDAIYVMILDYDTFQGFATLPRADTARTTAALIALSREDRAGVDAITAAALAAGGREPNPVSDLGFMYSRTFHDPDGNVFEAFWMDREATMAANPGEPKAS